MISMILFDFYGVFTPDPYNNWLASNGLQRQGIFAEVVTKLDRGSITKQEFFETLSREVGHHVNYDDIHGRSPVVDMAVTSLARRLSDNYPLGLLSNASPDLRTKLATLKLDKLFDYIFISSEMKLSKPQPEIFQAVLEAISCRPDQIVFIDDNADNVAAAQSIGIPSLKYKDCDNLERQLLAAGATL